MKKIPAYTLVEIMVALAITSIVIVLALNLYLQLVNSNNLLLREYNRNYEMLKLKSILNMDFERYKQIEIEENELMFIDDNTICLYEFLDFGVVRQYMGNSDTLMFQYSNLEYELQNKNSGMVNRFSFDVVINDDNFTYSFYKKYESEQRVNEHIFK